MLHTQMWPTKKLETYSPKPQPMEEATQRKYPVPNISALYRSRRQWRRAHGNIVSNDNHKEEIDTISLTPEDNEEKEVLHATLMNNAESEALNHTFEDILFKDNNMKRDTHFACHTSSDPETSLISQKNHPAQISRPTRERKKLGPPKLKRHSQREERSTIQVVL